MLMKDLVGVLPHPPIAYGKGAIVGTDGEIEHGAALLHPRLGKPIRDEVGGGEATICANAKSAASESSIDVPFAPQGQYLVVRSPRHLYGVDEISVGED